MGFAAIIPAILGVASSAVAISGQRQAAKYNRRLGEYESKLAANRAEAASLAARENDRETALRLSNQRREDRRFAGSQRAAYARAGVAEAGSALEVMGETAANQARGRIEIQKAGHYRSRAFSQESDDLLAQSQLRRYEADYEYDQSKIETAGLAINAGTSLLAGAGKSRRRTTQLRRAGLY